MYRELLMGLAGTMMKRGFSVLLILALFPMVGACGPSQAELDAQATKIAADIFATQTAEAPTPTATFTPTSTPTPTPSPTPTFTPTSTPTSTPTFTPTSTPTPMPTSTPTFTPTSTPTPAPTSRLTSTPRSDATLPPLPEGWRDHSASGFHLAAPERWEAVDIGEEGIEAIWNLLEGVETEWARNMTQMFSSEVMQEMVKFWAMDSEPAGAGYASTNVTYQSQPFSIEVDDLCAMMPSVYEQMDLDMVDAECNLEINELDAARFTIRLAMGPMAVKQYQYVYLQESDMWVVTFAVDETAWSEYEPIFATMAESFRVD